MDENLYKNLPISPGVYLMKDSTGRILYVGKAGNLRRRVASYFLRSHEDKTEQLLRRIAKIDYHSTDTAIEALILEAKLIKKHTPPFNIKEKDDKSFLFIEITKEKFPRVLLVRGKSVADGKRYGPFTSASATRDALKIIRRIFPFSTHATTTNPNYYTIDRSVNSVVRSCFDYEIGLCPGTCIGSITRKDYTKNIRNIKLFLEGKKERIIKNLKKEMIVASKNTEFEKAQKIQRQIFSLQHIQDIALLNNNFQNFKHSDHRSSSIYRIEGYDISNISGTSAVGSMVVFENGKPNKNEYRKFKIKTVIGQNDTGMLQEVLSRRFNNDWPKPNLILIDGGKGQVNAAKKILESLSLKIPVVGIAKGPERKKNEFIGGVPLEVDLRTLIKVRDEAHRFAISYHKKVRSREFLSSSRT